MRASIKPRLMKGMKARIAEMVEEANGTDMQAERLGRLLVRILPDKTSTSMDSYEAVMDLLEGLQEVFINGPPLPKEFTDEYRIPKGEVNREIEQEQRNQKLYENKIKEEAVSE